MDVDKNLREEVVGGVGLSSGTAVNVAVEGKGIAVVELPIEACAAANLVPLVAEVPAGLVHQSVVAGIFGVNPVESFFADLAAIADGAEGKVLVKAPTEIRPPCDCFAERVMTLMTPLTALAPQIVAPGPRITSMRSTSSSKTSF